VGASPVRRRDDRGVAFPSPVVMLSIISVAMAAVAFVATRNPEPTERQVTTVSRHTDPQQKHDGDDKTQEVRHRRTEPIKPQVERGKVYVEVYNNSGITGLAGQVAGKASGIGWQVVGSDNWYGTIPATTIYFPARLEKAARLLSKDIGVPRVMPAVDPMSMDRLTVIVTADYA
jgi:hypothetical protein